MSLDAQCPACHGHGAHDFADMDAYLEEHLDDAQLAAAKAASTAPWRGRLGCDECEGTGVVTPIRRKLLLAAARARVDQILAALEPGEGPPPATPRRT